MNVGYDNTMNRQGGSPLNQFWKKGSKFRTGAKKIGKKIWSKGKEAFQKQFGDGSKGSSGGGNYQGGVM